jgi:hypothetical protein
MKSIECSSRGYKKASAMYARVEAFGRIDTIENHYQSVKRDKDGNPVAKGKKVDHIEIYGHKLSPRYLTPLYKVLWGKYLDENEDVVKHLSQFDEFTDMFRGKCINCQADVIKQYIKEGRQSILQEEDVQELLRLIKIYKYN